MAKSGFAVIAGILLIALILQRDAGETIVSSSSCYTVHEPKDGYYWEKSKKLCEMNGSALVSIETKEELNYLKEQLTKKGLQNEYFIGLRNVNGNWKWISKSTLIYEHNNLPSKPKNKGVDCVKIYFPNMGQDSTVIFDDIGCKSERSRGYICERPVPCQDTKEDKKQEKKPATEGHPTTKPLPVTSAVHSTTTTQQQSGRAVSLATSPGKAISDVPASKAEKDNSQSITIALTGLAVIILVMLILMWFFFVRRPRSKASSFKTRPDDSNQHQENSSQITVRANLTPSEEGLDTYETVNKDKQMHLYEKVKNCNRMPRSASHRESTVHEQEPIMQSGDHNLVPPDLSESMETTKKPDPLDENYGEKKTRKEHVYAVVHVLEDQGRAIFRKDTTAQGQSLDLTATSHLPFIDESRENSSSVISQNPVTMTEDYLYAVVDKAKQKPKPPQIPAPYRSVVYSDLSHSPEKSAGGIRRRSLPTVYAAIDHGKTHEIKSKLPEENMDQSTESTDGSE